MVSSMDHKRACDGDTGLNTGGMGTIAPNPYYTAGGGRSAAWRRSSCPPCRAMNAEGRTFKGCLYFGLMLTPDGPKVIEYNCRFGDPETQVVLPPAGDRPAAPSCSAVRRRHAWPKWTCASRTAPPACVILASGGYPEALREGQAHHLACADGAAGRT